MNGVVLCAWWHILFRTETVYPNDNWARYAPGQIVFTLPNNPVLFQKTSLIKLYIFLY